MFERLENFIANSAFRRKRVEEESGVVRRMSTALEEEFEEWEQHFDLLKREQGASGVFS